MPSGGNWGETGVMSTDTNHKRGMHPGPILEFLKLFDISSPVSESAGHSRCVSRHSGESSRILDSWTVLHSGTGVCTGNP